MDPVPTDLRYTDTHLWVRPRGKLATVGLAPAAVARLGGVSFVELPYPGELFTAAARLGSVSSPGGSLALALPFVVQVNAVNAALADAPQLVADDPYGDGWILRVEPNDPADVDALLDADAYEALLAADAG